VERQHGEICGWSAPSSERPPFSPQPPRTRRCAPSRLPLGINANVKDYLGRHFIFTASVPNIEEKNSAISYYCHIGGIANVSARASASLLVSMINEPFFNVIRTQEQLGYNVSCTTWSTTVSIGLRFRVQSSRHPTFLESRINNFIDSYQTTLEAMSPEEFEERKRGVINKKREKLKNMAEERTRFWSKIDSEYYDFERGLSL
jgi:insulysin